MNAHPHFDLRFVKRLADAAVSQDSAGREHRMELCCERDSNDAMPACKDLASVVHSIKSIIR